MKNLFLKSILGIIFFSILFNAEFALAQPSVGAKLPFLTLPEFFAAYDINELTFEFGIPLSAIDSGFAIDANAKVFLWRGFPVQLDEFRFPVGIFLGLGGSVILISGALSTSVHVLMGFDYLLPKSHVDFFLEAAVALLSNPEGFDPSQGLLLGARYSF